MVLSGNNTYTGQTTLSAGKLLVTGAINTVRAYGYKGRPGRPPVSLDRVIEALGPPLVALLQDPANALPPREAESVRL